MLFGKHMGSNMKMTLDVPAEAVAQLRIEAKKRGISLPELCGLLLDHIAADNLVTAVLDDEPLSATEPQAVAPLATCR
jgi:hypothetical protein